MTYLLDTNLVSELPKDAREDPPGGRRVGSNVMAGDESINSIILFGPADCAMTCSGFTPSPGVPRLRIFLPRLLCG